VAARALDGLACQVVWCDRMMVTVMRWLDSAALLSLPTGSAQGARGGDGMHVSTHFAKGRGERRGKPGATRQFRMPAWQVR
jgi:hypothetical protein